MKKGKQKIAVLMGGPGSERDVSLATGRGVSKALRSTGNDVIDVDVRDKDFQLPKDVDVAFNCIHGTFGEDGQLQNFVEAKVSRAQGRNARIGSDRRWSATENVGATRCKAGASGLHRWNRDRE